MILEETYTLNNGVAIPKLALGTWLIDDAQVGEAVRAAVEIGYRHIDTAQAYANERGVGEAVRSCGVAREDLFVVSKVAAEHKTYQEAAAGIDRTLATMGLDYLDMMIIYSPQPWVEVNQSSDRHFQGNVEAYRALEDALSAGKLRAIGVSNFLVDDLQNILDSCSVVPAVNQVLAHVGNVPVEVAQFCANHGIAVEAYSPIAHGEAGRIEGVAEMAAKYGVSVAQLCIRYVLQLGMIALPKTANPVRMKENASVDFQISDEDMAVLNGIAGLPDYGASSFFPVFGGKL
ncbi:2,5-diketo-D-gluconic acid reductase [Denitrobacterium detoxificans]|uniref:Aldo/keto reductase n=1 Tax=Denitrobacterium detoxificans TaxID=79604 RepID=A0A172S000_9ACTN|nr:aldo/keto reductase [Denitrobacterium detoxificans]ANE23286.1 2,5-diketo-D-gluconic acid reductase [Denitrobacterium detoxificans]SEO39028.1 Aldo/keto reductase [Denitrobacterium detoxificans]